MKHTFLIATAALALVTVGYATTPPTQNEQAAHPPVGLSSAPKVDTAKVDQQIKVMQDMHAKMMATKTPEERAAPMQENMTAMQDGMAMIETMMQMMMDRQAMQAPAKKVVRLRNPCCVSVLTPGPNIRLSMA